MCPTQYTNYIQLPLPVNTTNVPAKITGDLLYTGCNFVNSSFFLNFLFVTIYIHLLLPLNTTNVPAKITGDLLYTGCNFVNSFFLISICYNLHPITTTSKHDTSSGKNNRVTFVNYLQF